METYVCLFIVKYFFIVQFFHFLHQVLSMSVKAGFLKSFSDKSHINDRLQSLSSIFQFYILVSYVRFVSQLIFQFCILVLYFSLIFQFCILVLYFILVSFCILVLYFCFKILFCILVLYFSFVFQFCILVLYFSFVFLGYFRVDETDHDKIKQFFNIFVFFGRFFLGGPLSIRGFKTYGIGPRSKSKTQCTQASLYQSNQIFALSVYETGDGPLWLRPRQLLKTNFVKNI